MKGQRTVVAVVLLLVVLALFWFSFIRPSVVLSDWEISNEGTSYMPTNMPHYSYHTITPYIYFKGGLLVPDGVEDYVLELSVDGCFTEVKVNGGVVYENPGCTREVPYDKQAVDLAGQITPGRNDVEVEILFDGGTTRFDVFEDRKFNLLRFTLIVVLSSIALYLLGLESRYVLSLLLLSLVFIHLFGESFSFNWGYNALQAFPWHVDVVLALLAVAFALPWSSDILAENAAKILSAVKKSIQSKRKKPKSKPSGRLEAELKSIKTYLAYATMSLVSFILFWTFRTHNSLGDHGFVGQIAIDKPYLFFNAAPLTSWTLTFAYNLLMNFGFTYNTYEVSALVACFFGALSIPAVWIICRELFESTQKRLMLFALVVSGYYMQMFFGYIEFYPLLLAAMVYYILFGVYYLKDKVSIMYPSTAFAIMFCIHASTGYLGLSLIMLYLYKVSQGGEEIVSGFLKMFLASLAVFLFLGHVIFVFGECNEGFMPCMLSHFYSLKGADASLFRPDFFTLTFLQEIYTEYLLIAPGAVLLLFYLTAFHRRQIEFKDRYLLFLLVGTAGFFFYTITQYTGTGLPNDWDAFAPIGFPLSLLVGYALLSAVKDKILVYCVFSVVSVTLVIHAIPTLLDSANREYILSNPVGSITQGVDSLGKLSTKAVKPKVVSLTLVDSVNVGSEASEKSHSYLILGEAGNGSHKTAYLDGTMLEDDYRSYTNQESFIVNSNPNQGLVIAKRVKCPTSQTTRVYLHGSYLGKMKSKCPNSNDMWDNIYFNVSGDIIEGSKVGLMFVSDTGKPVESHYYWIYAET